MRTSEIRSLEAWTLFAIYTLAHGAIFFISESIFWDDWTISGTKPEDILTTFKQAGAFMEITPVLHILLLPVGVWSYRALTFFLIFLSGIVFYKIITRFFWVDSSCRFLVTALYLITPLYSARVALIDFPYTFSMFIFLLGWLLIGRVRLLSLAFFFISFNTASLLVFYALPILDWYYRVHRGLNWKEITSFVNKRLDYIALPFVFFAIKNIFFSPYGLYKGYNQGFSLRYLVTTPVIQARDLFQLELSVGLIFVSLFAAWALIKLVSRETIVGPISERLVGCCYRKNIYVGAGLLSIFLGVFPYWILGHPPTFLEWTSRHQLLMPFGTAFFTVGLICCLKQEYQKSFLLLMVSFALAINWQNYYWFYVDSKKQELLIDWLSKSSVVNSADLVIFDDKTRKALSRKPRFYEWNGLLLAALPESDGKFGLSLEDMDTYKSGGFDKYFGREYKAEHHTRSGTNRCALVEISGTAFRYHFEAKDVGMCLGEIR